MVEGRLEKAVNKAGGADMHLFLGPKVTDKIFAELKFGVNGYKFSLEATADTVDLHDELITRVAHL